MIRGAAQEELRGDPPVGEVDGLLGLLEGDGDCPKVVTTVDVPLDEVAISLREVRLVAMRLTRGRPLLVATLLVLFVVAMVPVELQDGVRADPRNMGMLQGAHSPDCRAFQFGSWRASAETSLVPGRASGERRLFVDELHLRIVKLGVVKLFAEIPHEAGEASVLAPAVFWRARHGDEQQWREARPRGCLCREEDEERAGHEGYD